MNMHVWKRQTEFVMVINAVLTLLAIKESPTEKQKPSLDRCESAVLRLKKKTGEAVDQVVWDGGGTQAQLLLDSTTKQQLEPELTTRLSSAIPRTGKVHQLGNAASPNCPHPRATFWILQDCNLLPVSKCPRLLWCAQTHTLKTHFVVVYFKCPNLRAMKSKSSLTWSTDSAVHYLKICTQSKFLLQCVQTTNCLISMHSQKP